MLHRCLVSLYCVLLLAACSSKEEPAAKPQITQTPQTAQPAQPAAPADTRPAIVALGDSLTAGLGVEQGQAWPEVLQQMIDQKGLSYRVVNQGISGDTTSGGVARLQAALDLKPAVVILELGANDGLRGLPVTSTEQNLDQMMGQLNAAGVKVLLAGITLPRNYGLDYIRDFDRIYPALARKHKAVYIPFLLEGVALNPQLMQRDELHPNANGHRKMAALVWKYLEPVLK